MQVVVLNYPNSSVDFYDNVDESEIETKYEDNIGNWLQEKGYHLSDINFMCGDYIQENKE